MQPGKEWMFLVSRTHMFDQELKIQIPARQQQRHSDEWGWHRLSGAGSREGWEMGALESQWPFRGSSHHSAPRSSPLDVVLWECGSRRARYCDFQTNTDKWNFTWYSYTSKSWQLLQILSPVGQIKHIYGCQEATSGLGSNILCRYLNAMNNGACWDVVFHQYLWRRKCFLKKKAGYFINR